MKPVAVYFVIIWSD